MNTSWSSAFGFLLPLRWLQTAWLLWKEARQVDHERLNSSIGAVFVALCRLRLRTNEEIRRKGRNPARPVETLMGFNVVGGSYESLSYLFRDVILSGDYDPGGLDTVRPVIIDVGANIGLSVLYFKRLFPESTIYAFEPNPQSFALLHENVSRNKLKDVFLFNVALGREEGPAFLYTSGEVGAMTASLSRERGGAQRVDVQLRCLSRVLKEIGRVDFVKIDCEGAEVLILDDLQNSKRIQGIPRMVIEYHHMIGTEAHSLGRFLQVLEAAEYDYSISASKLPFESDLRFQDILLRVYRRHPTSSTQQAHSRQH
jgi:FkbM family methyltransferase